MKRFLIEKYKLITALVVTFPYVAFAQRPQGIIKCEQPPNCSFDELIETVLALFAELIKISLLVVSIAIAYAGWLYMTSGGDSGKRKQANKIFTNSAVGFIIVLSAFLIIELILNVLGYAGNSGSGNGVINLF